MTQKGYRSRFTFTLLGPRGNGYKQNKFRPLTGPPRPPSTDRTFSSLPDLRPSLFCSVYFVENSNTY